MAVAITPEPVSQLNKKDFFTYFEILGGSRGSRPGWETEVFTGAFLTDKTAPGVLPNFGVIYGTPLELWKLTRVIKRKVPDAALHITLNRTSNRGRRNEHIEACRVFCVDLDAVMPAEEADEILPKIITRYAPALIVQSSPGKYHIYWRASELVSLENWSRIQAGLFGGFGGLGADIQLDQIAKTLRVPGVPRYCKDGSQFVPEIIYADKNAAALDWNGVFKLFPDFNSWIDAGIKLKSEFYAELRKINAKLNNGGFDLAAVQKVGRNPTLYALVKDLCAELKLEDGKVLPEVSYDEALIYAESINEKFSEPLGALEVARCAQNGHRKGTARREAKLGSYNADRALLDTNSNAPTDTFPYDYQHELLKEDRFSDTAVVGRVLQKFGHYLVRADTRLFAFNGEKRVWVHQRDKLSMELTDFVADVCMDTLHDPDFENDLCYTEKGQFSKSKEGMAKRKFLGHHLQTSTVKRVKQEKRIATYSDSKFFDADPNLFYCASGVIDLATGICRDAEAADYLLHRSLVTYDPLISWNDWEAFITEVFSENEQPDAMVTFMQELFGYSLMAGNPAAKCFCHVGGGSNGKSKVLYALSLLCGSYCTVIEPDMLTKSKKGFDVKFERLGKRLDSYRVGIVDDVDVGSSWNETFIKQCSGGKLAMQARELYEVSHEVVNRAKVHIGMNKIPKPESLTGDSYPLVRRLCLIPYRKRFNPHLKSSEEVDYFIESNLSAILNWAIKGYQRIREQEGINYPVETVAAITEYQDEYFVSDQVVRALFSLGTGDIKDKRQWVSAHELASALDTAFKKQDIDEKVNYRTVLNIIKRSYPELIMKQIRETPKESPIKKWNLIINELPE